MLAPALLERGVEQAGGVGVVVDGEVALAAGFVDSGAAPEHLVEEDGRLDVAEPDEVLQAGDVDAGGDQVDGGGDEGASAAAAQVGEQIAAALRGASEGVGLGWRLAVRAAPFDVLVVDRLHDSVGVGDAVAEDQGLLMRAAGFEQALEEVGGHCADAVGQQQVEFERAGAVLLAQVFERAVVAAGRFADARALEALALDARETIEGVSGPDIRLDDLHRGKIAVLHGLGDGVLVDGLAEVVAVVGGDAQVVALVDIKRVAGVDVARRGGEADLHGVGVALEHFAPLAPGGAVALVDDDVAEVVLGVVLGEE